MRRWIGVVLAAGLACAVLWAAGQFLDPGPFNELADFAGVVSLVLEATALAGSLSVQRQTTGVSALGVEPDWVRSAVRTTDADLMRLGVHVARSGGDGGQQPSYVARDTDSELDQRLTAAAKSPRGGLVLVAGGSMAGKSRALAAAVQRTLPRRRLVIPPEGVDLSDLPAWLRRRRWRGRHGWVVWLDDLERYLPHARLEPSLVDALGMAGAIVAATIRWEELQALKPATDERGQAVGYKVLQPPALVLRRRWSSEERARAARSRDERLLEAAQQDTLGVAAYVGAGPRLEQDWRHGPEEGAVRGHALVTAAVDLARTGLSTPLTRQQIEHAASTYLPAPPPAPEDPDQAWEWATAVRSGVAGLLVPTVEQHWRAFDYLTNQTAIPETTWRTALDYASEAERYVIGITAYRNEHPGIAEAAWTPLAQNGDSNAMVPLGILLHDFDRAGEAEQWWRRAADRGHVPAMFIYGLFLQEDGRLEESEQWYRRAADRDYADAMVNLGHLLRQDGRWEEAEQWWRRAADRGHVPAMFNFGLFLQEDGRLEESEQWYRRAAEHGDVAGMNNLGHLLRQDGRWEEAKQWWRRAADHGDTDAMVELGDLLKQDGRWEEAEQWWRQAAEHGDVAGMNNLGLLLHETGRAGKTGEQWLRRAAEHGDPRAMLNLCIVLYEKGRIGEAEQWVQRAANHNDIDQTIRDFLAEQDCRHEEAEQ